MESGTGYRFHPTEEELINYYLRLKMLGRDDEVNMIPEVNLVKVEPWEIPGKAMRMSNDQVWYFFCPPNYKYSNSQIVDRKTKGGFWKVTGKDRKILRIGVKKTLVYYQGQSSNAVKTDWVVHQYNATFDFPNKRDFTICKLKYKADSDDMSAMDLQHGQSSNYTQNQNNYGEEVNQQLPYNSEYYPTTEDDSYQVQAHMQSFHGYNKADYSLDSAMNWSNGNNYYG